VSYFTRVIAKSCQLTRPEMGAQHEVGSIAQILYMLAAIDGTTSKGWLKA